MTAAEAVLALAAAVAMAGLGPLVYVLSRQRLARRERRAGSARLRQARAAIAGGAGSDVEALAQALSPIGAAATDQAIAQLVSEDGFAEHHRWLSRLAMRTGTFERCCQRAQSAFSWSERAHSVRILGHFGIPEAIPVLAALLRDNNEDDTVRSLAADALASVHDEAVVPLLALELRQVDERATPRVAEALIRFGKAATPALIELLRDKGQSHVRVWAARIIAATHDATAVEALLGALRDRDDALRAASAEALGSIADPRALQLLMQVSLRDPAPLVRAQAAAAAAQISGTEAAEFLIATLSDPDYATRLRGLEAFESMKLSDTSALERALNDTNPEVQRRAALALERLGYLDGVVERLASDDRRVRTSAYAALLQVGRAGLVDGIVGRIGHPSMQVRTAIARACGELRTDRARDALIGALGDPAWPVRAAVCESIGQLRPPGGDRALIAVLRDPEESVREAAANGIAAYAGVEVDGVEEAIRVAYEQGSVPVRLSMVAVAGASSSPGMSQLLIDALKDPSATVRLRAIGALGARPDPAATPALIGALTDASMEVRAAAVPALGATGAAEAFEALLRTLAGAPPAMRERIADVLSGVGRHHLLQNIGELAKASSLDVRLGIAWTLGKIGEASGLAVLFDFLQDPDPRLRASAAGALGKIPDASAVATLVRAVDDPDPKTRAAVVNALGKCGGHPHVTAALERRLRDPDQFVRNRAGIALARAAGPEVADLARSEEAERQLDDPALVLMQGLAGTPETVSLALAALRDPARLPRIQEFFDREEPAVCVAFLGRLKLHDGAAVGIRPRLDPASLAIQYEKLLRASRDPAERRAAVEALAGVQGGAQITLFADALGADPEDLVRLRCAEVLSHLADEPVARRALIRAVSDPNPDVAVAAIEGLRTKPDPETAAILFRRLGAGSAVVNQAVEQALAEIYQNDVVGFMDRTMGLDRPAAMVAAIRVLELLGHSESVPLLQQLVKSQDPEVRAATVRALANTGSPVAKEMIGKMLDDPSDTVRIAALEVMSRERPGSLVRLGVARTDPSIAVRSRLCQLLEGFPAAAAAKLLEQLLEDAAPEVRGAALVTLLSFGDAESLRRFSQYWTTVAAETASAVQRDSRARSITRKLSALLRSGGDNSVRELAVVAIAALGTDEYPQLLLPVLRDPRASVRFAAARALASSRADVEQHLRQLSSDPDLEVRNAVREALLSLSD